MEGRFERIKNFNVSVKEMKDQVLFLRKLAPGGSAHSFGIHVAKMAGCPNKYYNGRKETKTTRKSHEQEDRKALLQKEQDQMQLSFISLDDPLLEDLKAEIIDLDIDTLTPVEALMKLNNIKRRLGENSLCKNPKKGFNN